MGLALLAVLLVLVFFTRPGARRGYGTAGLLALLALIVLVGMMFGYIPWASWDWSPSTP